MGLCPVPTSPPSYHLQMEDEDSACKEETKALTVKQWSVQDVYLGLEMQGRQRETPGSSGAPRCRTAQDSAGDGDMSPTSSMGDTLV